MSLPAFSHHHHLLLLPLSTQTQSQKLPHHELGHHSHHVAPPPPSHRHHDILASTPQYRLAQRRNQPNGRLAAPARVEERGFRERGERLGRMQVHYPPPLEQPQTASHHPTPRNMHSARQLTCTSLLRGYRGSVCVCEPVGTGGTAGFV
jgi:hypothetical protein